jgi:hypothetical protein
MPMLNPIHHPLSVLDSEVKRAALVTENDDLDCVISALLAAGTCDDLLIKRLKKRKLHLKDEIALLLPMVIEARSAAN